MSIKMWLHPQQLLFCFITTPSSKPCQLPLPLPASTSTWSNCPEIQGVLQVQLEKNHLSGVQQPIKNTQKNSPRNLYLLKHMPGSSMYFLCLDIIFSMCFFAFLPAKFCFSLKSVKHYLSLIPAVLNFTNTGEVS